MYSSKNAPVAPSAKNHSSAGAATADAACAGAERTPPLSRYMARSTTMSWSDGTRADTSVPASSGDGLVHPDRVAAARRRRVRAVSGALGVGQQVETLTVAVAAARVLQQVEEIEAAAGGAFGEVPLPPGAATAPSAWLPRPPFHVIVRSARDGDVGLDLVDERSGDLRRCPRWSACGATRADVERQPHDLAVAGQQRDEDTCASSPSGFASASRHEKKPLLAPSASQRRWRPRG